MSFSFSFVAKKEHVNHIVEDFQAPFEVGAFISQAVAKLEADQLVYVKASGHLMQDLGDYDQSTAEILVEPLSLRIPLPREISGE